MLQPCVPRVELILEMGLKSLPTPPTQVDLPSGGYYIKAKNRLIITGYTIVVLRLNLF